MTTAFVLSGGGSLGAVQVGMLQALGARGVSPDLLVGTSSGALNAVWVAHHGLSEDSLAGLARLWGRIRRADVFPVHMLQVGQAILGRSSAICSAAGLDDLVRTHAGIGDLTEAAIPVHLVATDLLTGAGVLISSGCTSDAVLASAAIPGVFPPVHIDGRPLIDGAVAGHSGIAQAIQLGATEIYVLPGGVACALPHPPRSALAVAIHALTLLIEQRLVAEVAAAGGSLAQVKVLPPLCPLAVSAADFAHAPQLIRRAREASAAWLSRGGIDLPGQEHFLSLHGHAAEAAD